MIPPIQMGRVLQRGRFFGLILCASLVVWFLITNNPGEVSAHLKGVDWRIAWPTLLTLVAIHLLQIETWRLLSVRLTGCRLHRPAAIAAYFTGQALGSVTPGNLGGDVYRAYATKSGSHGWRDVAGPIVGQRAVSYASLLALTGIAGILRLVAATSTEVTVFGFVILMTPLTAVWIKRDAIIECILPMLGMHSVPGVSASHSLLRVADHFKPAVVLGLGFHLGSVVFTYLLVLSIGESPPFVPTLGVLLIVRSATLLAITPFGLGLQEGGLMLLLPSVGLDAEAALAISILSRLGLLLTVVFGIGCFLGNRFGLIRGLTLDGPKSLSHDAKQAA